MSFDDTSKDIWLEHGHILHASCKDNQGDYVDSQIDLDLYIGNDDGKPTSQVLLLLLLFGLSAKEAERTFVFLLWALAP